MVQCSLYPCENFEILNFHQYALAVDQLDYNKIALFFLLLLGFINPSSCRCRPSLALNLFMGNTCFSSQLVYGKVILS